MRTCMSEQDEGAGRFAVWYLRRSVLNPGVKVFPNSPRCVARVGAWTTLLAVIPVLLTGMGLIAEAR